MLTINISLFETHNRRNLNQIRYKCINIFIKQKNKNKKQLNTDKKVRKKAKI